MRIADMETQLRNMAREKQSKNSRGYTCKKCYGTGRTGFLDGVPIPCKCTGTTIREMK